jgi:(p)ppGpp synthase/HD superfamily hydrolase
MELEQDYTKQKIVIRAWLQGRGYFNALRAMDFAEKKHVGVRKDGSPEFSHQVSQALYAITLVDYFLFPQEMLCLIFLHDILEDTDTTEAELEKLFGSMVSKASVRISKVRNGVRIPDEIYYKEMEECPLASVAKGIDRFHNILSMLGGFTPEKQVSYVEETIKKVLPLLKFGRRRFPEQTAAYENIKLVLIVQLRLYNELNKHLISK